ncbi:hypothetical protein BDR22DRAFT_888482 [Usnea florida]
MAPSTPFKYIQRKRALKHASKPTAVAKITSRPYINPQIASPLFSRIPAEIREHIFYYALLAYPDPTRPYSKHSFFYRPGYTHARAIAVNLLLTCRRIYLETDLLPVVYNEHVVWGVEKSRIPPGARNYLLQDRDMKLAQRNAVRCVHLFTQQYWLEDWRDQWLEFTTSWPEGGPNEIRITIRHTDWWYNLLGENSPLALDPKRKGRARIGEVVPDDQPYESGSWGSRFTNLKGLKKLEMELETTVSKSMELNTIAEKAQSWKFPLGDGNVLVMDEESTVTSSWTGSKYFKGLNAPNVPAGLQLRQGSTGGFSTSKPPLRYGTEPEELGPGDELDYCVVVLTWHAQRTSEHDDAAIAADARSNLIEKSASSATTNTAVSQYSATASRAAYNYNRYNPAPTYYG